MAEKGTVLIIGGGISGVAVALELAQLKVPATLIERAPSLGGLSASFCCKASEACNKCFACVADKKMAEIRQCPDISILTQTELIDVKGCPGRYHVSLRKGHERVSLDVSAMVVAAGVDPYEASQKVEYGYSRFKNVITARDLEEMLRYQGKLIRPSDGQLPKRVAFFQCVGSRDESIGNLYCSQVCCAYALRLIKAIRYQFPEVSATFLYMDIQPAGASFQQFLDSCRKDKGIRLIRSLPSKVFHTPVSDLLRVRFIDPEKGEVVEESFDLIVLSVGMVLQKNAISLTKLLGLSLTEDGFIAPPKSQTGVFVTGACSGPKDIDRSILQAKSTAVHVNQYLKERNEMPMSEAIRKVSNAKPIESQSLELKPEVLVLGGGITGISIARALAQSGIHVSLLEQGSGIGGRAIELRRFYNRSGDVKGWIDEKTSEVEKNPNITLFTQAELKRLDGHLGRFQATIRQADGGETILSASAIVVATGYETRRERKGIYGHRRVLTLSEMEGLLSENAGPELLWKGNKVQMITFLLDGVNEDIKIDSINAIKQSLLLQESFDCQVAVLCKDVKVSADGMERLYRKARGKGVLFFKYEEPPKLSIVNGHIQVDVKDTAAIEKAAQWPVSIPSDLIVVSEAFVPSQQAEALSGLLKIHLGNRGFLMEDNPQLLRVRSNRRGIFVAGACRFPQELSESLVEARAAAHEVIALLSNGAYTYDRATAAEVDPKKCAVCYTCSRLCPHSAITVENYAERNVYAAPGRQEENKWGAAKVDPAACYACGICVAECPAKAINLRNLTDEMIYRQMGLEG